VYRNEFRLRCADGSYRFMRSEAKVVQRDAAGAAVRLIGHHQDITERIEEQRRHEEIEAQLRQAQKLEAVGRLAGGVAHEFNNLLTVVAGNLSLARMDLGHDHPVRQLLGESLVATNRAAELTRQLLSFSRRQPVAPRAISLNEVVRHQAAMLQRTLGEQIRISVATDYGLARIHADLGQLEQVLLNLALNARDAMPGGGKLLLETAMVTFDDPPTMVHGPLKPGDYVMLAVQDSGHGIAPEHLDKIFDPFFSTRPVGSGSGLGLSMVIGAVEQIGASIQVESTAGHGTVFRIYFPALQGAVRAEGGAPVEVAARPQDDESPQGHETILVVEDEAIVRRMTVMALRRCGYTVVEAASGPEALLQVRTRDEPVDLVLTDVVMPRMDGRELVRQLHERTPDLPVLYTSGYGEDVIARHGVLDEGVELLVKPFDPAMLARRVRELLDR
jgi:signal transduction histidine kinase